MNKDLFSLGEIYVSNFVGKDHYPKNKPKELKLIMDNDGFVKLNETVPQSMMYGQYWYRSGITDTMKKELKGIVDSILDIYEINRDEVWLDIACNDGTLLSNVPQKCIRIGIDPADDSYKKESEKHSDLIIQDYFTSSLYKKSKYGNKKAKVITTIAMFYDLEEPDKFIQDVNEILDNDGLWVIQLSYTPLMIEQLAFDNICHEHVYYYSLFNLKKLLNKNNFKIMDVQLNDINGGSFRVYIMKNKGNEKKFGSKPYRDVCRFRIESLLNYENNLNLDKVETWKNFFNKIKNLKEKTILFIKNETAKGKIIWGYGASTKGNTLLQYFKLDENLIEAIAERSEFKIGLKTIGSNIPILSEKLMRERKPDYLLILPWHFINEFKQRESEYLKSGGKFIVPCPEFEVIGYDND